MSAGKGQWWDHLAEDVECPIVLEVWTNVNVWDESEECDYRFKEFYREPGVGLHIATSCSKLTHGVVYTAHVKVYFACVETEA